MSPDPAEEKRISLEAIWVKRFLGSGEAGCAKALRQVHACCVSARTRRPTRPAQRGEGMAV